MLGFILGDGEMWTPKLDDAAYVTGDDAFPLGELVELPSRSCVQVTCASGHLRFVDLHWVGHRVGQRPFRGVWLPTKDITAALKGSA